MKRLRHRYHHRLPARQTGISLIVILMLLIASVFLGTSAAVVALQAEKASRGDRDRQGAFQAAEAALIDAQLDIDTAPTSGGPNARAMAFLADSALGFPGVDQPTYCFSGSNSPTLGLCRRVFDNGSPSWLQIDLADTSSGSASVAYGHFTGQTLPTAHLSLPAKLPRYVIELMPYNQPGQSAETASYAYRITAIGFGADGQTQVVLQTFYRKDK